MGSILNNQTIRINLITTQRKRLKQCKVLKRSQNYWIQMNFDINNIKPSNQSQLSLPNKFLSNPNTQKKKGTKSNFITMSNDINSASKLQTQFQSYLFAQNLSQNTQSQNITSTWINSSKPIYILFKYSNTFHHQKFPKIQKVKLKSELTHRMIHKWNPWREKFES